jgi:hypothetical protein
MMSRIVKKRLRKLHQNRPRRRPRHAFFEVLEPRQLLVSDWQNPHLPLDISGDGLVVPIDALLIVNELNARSISGADGRLPVPTETVAPPPFLDPTGDGIVAPLDALRVINALNGDAVPPTIQVTLERDTAAKGATNDDGLTFDPTVAGKVQDDRTGVLDRMCPSTSQRQGIFVLFRDSRPMAR